MHILGFHAAITAGMHACIGEVPDDLNSVMNRSPCRTVMSTLLSKSCNQANFIHRACENARMGDVAAAQKPCFHTAITRSKVADNNIIPVRS